MSIPRPEKVRIKGRKGNVDYNFSTSEDGRYNIGQGLESHWGATRHRLYDMHSKDNDELIDIAFKNVLRTPYGLGLLRHFKGRTGQPKTFILQDWDRDFWTGRNALYDAIANEVIEQHANFHCGYTIDISSALSKTHPSFRLAPFHLDEMIAIGGVQEVEVEDRSFWDSEGYDYWDAQGRIKSKDHTIRVKFRITLKDIFGVDEADFANYRIPSLVDGKGIAALWTLQHQRGYPAFIAKFQHDVTMDLNLGQCSRATSPRSSLR